MDIWGFCRTCQRWFFCEGWADNAAARPLCPVCASEAQAIENRATPGDRELIPERAEKVGAFERG